MKTATHAISTHPSGFGLLILAACLLFAPVAHAGLTFELYIYRNNQGQTYQFYTPLSTNSTAPDAPLGTYVINSPQWPTNGSTRSFELTTNGLNTTSGEEHWTYYDFDTVMQQITNGTWTILFTNATTTNLYTFTVSAPTMTSNMLPATIITFPSDGALILTNQPTFTWQAGPSWPVTGDAYVFNSDWSFFQYASLPPSQNDWTISVPIPDGIDYNLNVRYVTNNATPVFVATTPLNTNSSHRAISGWISTSTLETSGSVSFAVTNTVSSGGAHTLVAHYPFDNSGYLGQDTSGNGNDMNGQSWWGTPHHQFDTDAEAGGAVQFFGTTSMTPSGSTLASWDSTLAGSFTVSAWIKTTTVVGNDDDDLSDYNGQSIIYADNNNLGATPVALTGSKVAFRTTDPDGNDDTLHSIQSVTTGSYVHIVSTRDQITGEKKIYINGVLDNSNFASTESLTGAEYVSIGGEMFSDYSGLVDDVQIYSGVLSASEVADIYNNPGSTAPDVAANNVPLGDALNAPQLSWTTTGDAAWFGQTNNAHDGVSAAQSGIVTNFQTTTLQTTVTGPGTITFWWQNPTFNNLDLEFDLDGNYQYNIGSGSTDWAEFGPSPIPPGQHTLSWTVFANGDNDPTQAAYLDEVTFIPDTAPVITLNPFNQTNYPGYNVGLLAAATNAANSPTTWQWFKVGNVSPIPNATNALFIPTNSGTAGVVGSYYAVASTPGGSTPTTAASVSFVSASLPPDWAHALKSPFFPVDGSVFNKDYYLGCAVDSAGDIYAAAFYVGNMNVVTNGNDANVLTAVGANGAAALVKHDANGNALWAVGLTNNQSTSSSYGQCVAPAPGNGAYLASILQGTNWLGTNKFVDAGGGSILLSRFNASGSNVWSKFIGGTNSIYIGYNMLVSDASGNVTLAGHMSGTVSFGGTNLSSPAGGGFIVQYDANGAVRWAQTIPVYTYGLAYGNGLLYVSLQSAVISGVTNASIGSLSNVTDRAWAVACLNATNGQPLWLRGVGHPYGANFSGLINDMPLIAVSGTNVFLTANAYGSSVVFGSLSVPLPGGRGQYFARYDTNGTPRAASVFGSPTTMIWASAANASGVYVSGDFDSYSQFGNLVIAAPVFTTNDLDFSYNGFDYIYFTQPLVAKFDLNGNPLWARNGVSSAFANFRGIATTSDGVWASGFLKVKDISSPAQFGTNYVSSDLYVPGVGVSTINFTQAGMIAKIGESGGASPVTLLNPQDNGVNFQFQFQSQAGVTNSVQYRTNLVIGNWLTYTNVTGDGTLKTSMIPLSVFSPSKQGFIRVSTQ